MNATRYLFSIIFISFIHISCEKDYDPTLEDFCSIVPDVWECEIIEENFAENDIPRKADNPIAIIKYKNPNKEFTGFAGMKVNPSLILNLYSIKRKKELIEFIKLQQAYSWCIPSYYGETKNYFIITSPCFINGGMFTEEADSCISDLHAALKRIIEKKDYGFMIN